MLPRPLIAVAMLILAAGQAAAQVAVEATSLLGHPLRGTALDSPEVRTREEWLVTHPAEARYYTWVADAFIEIRALGRAKTVLTTAIERLGERPELLRERGRLAIRMRDFDSAIRDLTAATLGDRSSFLAHYSLGVAHFLAGHWEQAIQSLEAALQVTKEDQGADALCWQLFAARRAGRSLSAHASKRLQRVIAAPTAAGVALRVYQGGMSVAEARQSEVYKNGSDFIEYAVGESALRRGSGAEARKVFEAILNDDEWQFFTYVAAEAELARVRR
jgi:tetratricopeptide (TPR) repeat protein